MASAPPCPNPGNPVLVTDASTPLGFATVRALLDLGAWVRVPIPTEADIPDGLQGADFMVGGPGYRPGREGLECVRVIFFSNPIGPETVEQAVTLANEARADGIKRLFTAVSGRYFGAGPSEKGSRISRVESVFGAFGLSEGAHLRVEALLMEELASFDGPAIRRTGRIANAYGDAPLSWILAADVGAVLARAMTDEAITWRELSPFGGTERHSYAEVAAIISDIVGQRVGYEALTPDGWREELKARALALHGTIALREIEERVDEAIWTRRGNPMRVTDHVQAIAGRAPTALAEFVRAHAASFQPSG